MTGDRTLPPSSGTSRKWGDAFNPGRTLGIYINLVRMAAILLNCHNARITPELRIIANGLRGEQDRSSAFPNFIRSLGLFGIAESGGRQSDIGMIAFTSPLFPLVLPKSTIRHAASPGSARVRKTYEVPRSEG